MSCPEAQTSPATGGFFPGLRCHQTVQHRVSTAALLAMHPSATPSSAPSAAPGAVDTPLPAVSPDGCQMTVDTLLQSLLAQSGAQGGVLAWYERGHAHIGTEVGIGLPDDPMQTAILAAMEEAIDQGVSLHHPPSPDDPQDWVTLAHRRLSERTGASMVTVPLPGADQALGAVMLYWQPASPLSQQTCALLEQRIQGLAPLLSLLRLSGRPWHWHLRQTLNRQLRRWRQPDTRTGKHLRTAAIGVCMALVLMPWPERVGGHARVEGAQQRVLVSPTDGFIKATHVLPGDQVKTGQVLVDLAEQDLKLERDKWLSQIAQQDNAYAAAMTRADRSEAAISLSRLEEAQSQLALVDEQLQRAQLKAPFDGVVIQGDLSQSIGAPVKQGDVLITVASTRSYRIIIDVDESDIARIQPGQQGVMALSALPWHTMDIKVQRITPQALAKEGRNVYEVQAVLDEALPADIRPGLMGPAKIRIGTRPPLWGWTRPLIDRVRLMLWSWWG